MNAAPTRPSNKRQRQGAQDDPKEKQDWAQGRVRANKILGHFRTVFGRFRTGYLDTSAHTLETLDQ
jgi:hypothetical protein